MAQELFTVYCGAPQCERELCFYSQELARTHFERIHQDKKHWAYVKPEESRL